MRKIIILLSLVIILLPFSCWAESPLVIKASDYPQGGGIKIKATEALIFDTQSVVFSAAHGLSFGPSDTIALHYMGDDIKGYYSLPYKSDTSAFLLDSKTLTPRKSPPFPGFEAGATVFLMVGRELSEDSLDMGVFADQWLLNIRVER